MTKDNYQVEIGYNTLSIQPYYANKNGIKWYVLSIVVLLMLMFYFKYLEYVLMIDSAVIILVIMSLLTELFLKIPIRYTFGANQNKVFRSNLIQKNVAIISLQNMVIFTNSSNDGWCYAIGEKKNQFVKNYKISAYFGDGKKSLEKSQAFETEILPLIVELQNN